MERFILAKGGFYFFGMEHHGGQPMATLVALEHEAKKFRTRATAQAFLDKWSGAGVGLKVFHIRQRLRPRGGNQFYRDKSERVSETFCGAPPTEFDVAWNDRAQLFLGRVPCKECMRLRDGRRQETGMESKTSTKTPPWKVEGALHSHDRVLLPDGWERGTVRRYVTDTVVEVSLDDRRTKLFKVSDLRKVPTDGTERTES